ncbi:response regulator transcription factor [Marinigracilibium pacificum]|nr:LuxR C-terminal-related transcriptional regulator [Marinigracilibium pacificum]
MQRSLLLSGFLFLVISHFCFGQYSISGYLDTPMKNKRVYLSLLSFDEQSTMATKQFLMSTLTDSSGYFSFEGKLLSEKHAFYRIHSRIEEDQTELQLFFDENRKNFHVFIFSNQDTIVFKRNNKYWFSSNTNTNPIDREWQEIDSYANRLTNELLTVTDSNQKNQSFAQVLSELKAYSEKKKFHPLVTLISLSEVEPNILKEDFKNDPGYYEELQNSLNDYYDNDGYAKQLKELIIDFSKAETQQDLDFYRRMTYILGALSSFLIIGVVFLFIKLNQKGNEISSHENINLTNQEERIADLIIQDKSNKEIANELFVSLSTVKTHIRNIYAKLEVSNRQEFVDKIKNQSRD